MITSLAGAVLAASLSGRILLQVESHGEAWYVNPADNHRYYLGTPDDAWDLMRELGLGITNADLMSIPINEGQAFPAVNASDIRKRTAGRILLQVESHGEAWYVDPITLTRVYLGRPSDAFAVMRRFGLGITNMNLSNIPESGGASESINQTGVPFTAQAPYGNWSDPREQEGCEEASALMAVRWARGETLTLADAVIIIHDMSDWEQKNFGYYYDTSAQDTADRLIRDYLDFDNVSVKTNIDTQDIKDELKKGNIVLVTTNGQKLNNPNFVGGGPLRHMIVIHGFDESTNEFITHDPGTRMGENYRYSESTIENALMDYDSGNHAAIKARPTAMIIIEKE